jgi:hypothetical protein
LRVASYPNVGWTL